MLNFKKNKYESLPDKLKFDWVEMYRMTENNELDEQSKLVKLESWYKLKNMIPVSNNAIESIIDYVKIQDVAESMSFDKNLNDDERGGKDMDMDNDDF